MAKGAATSGFVKLRRGINEHLVSGRITPEEYAVYVYMIVEADHRNGVWKGSGEAIAARFGWCLRRAQMVLASLFSKGYATSRREHRGRGNYPIKINKYFTKAHPDAPSDINKAHVHAPDTPKGAPGCALKPNKAHGDATYQEVRQEELLQEKSRALPRRVLSTRSEGEQRRIVEARDRRIQSEQKVLAEARVGMGPRPIGPPGTGVKPEFLERYRERLKTGKA